jgi:hypothetical protein
MRHFMVDPDNDERLLKVPPRVVQAIKAEAYAEAGDSVLAYADERLVLTGHPNMSEDITAALRVAAKRVRALAYQSDTDGTAVRESLAESQESTYKRGQENERGRWLFVINDHRSDLLSCHKDDDCHARADALNVIVANYEYHYGPMSANADSGREVSERRQTRITEADLAEHAKNFGSENPDTPPSAENPDNEAAQLLELGRRIANLERHNRTDTGTDMGGE